VNKPLPIAVRASMQKEAAFFMPILMAVKMLGKASILTGKFGINTAMAASTGKAAYDQGRNTLQAMQDPNATSWQVARHGLGGALMALSSFYGLRGGIGNLWRGGIQARTATKALPEAFRGSGSYGSATRRMNRAVKRGAPTDIAVAKAARTKHPMHTAYQTQQTKLTNVDNTLNRFAPERALGIKGWKSNLLFGGATMLGESKLNEWNNEGYLEDGSIIPRARNTARAQDTRTPVQVQQMQRIRDNWERRNAQQQQQYHQH